MCQSRIQPMSDGWSEEREHGSIDAIHGKVEVVQRENKQLKETLLDVQCRSMRDHLIFSGIPENDNSRGCGDTFRDFMSTQLKLPTDVVRNATFSRVHRIGKSSGNRPQAIIACFEHFKQKEMARLWNEWSLPHGDQWKEKINYIPSWRKSVAWINESPWWWRDFNQLATVSGL